MKPKQKASRSPKNTAKVDAPASWNRKREGATPKPTDSPEQIEAKRISARRARISVISKTLKHSDPNKEGSRMIAVIGIDGKERGSFEGPLSHSLAEEAANLIARSTAPMDHDALCVADGIPLKKVADMAFRDLPFVHA